MGLVNHLFRHHQIARFEFLAQRSHRARCQYVRASHFLQCINIGPIRHLRRIEQMPRPMPGQKIYGHARPFGLDDRIARPAEGCMHLMPGAAGMFAKQLPQSRTTDNPDFQLIHMPKGTAETAKSQVLTARKSDMRLLRRFQISNLKFEISNLRSLLLPPRLFR